MKGPITWNENGEMVPLSEEAKEAWAGEPAAEEDDPRVLKISRGRMLLKIFDQIAWMSLRVVAGFVVALIGMAIVLVFVPTTPLKILAMLGIGGLVGRFVVK